MWSFIIQSQLIRLVILYDKYGPWSFFGKLFKHVFKLYAKLYILKAAFNIQCYCLQMLATFSYIGTPRSYTTPTGFHATAQRIIWVSKT